MINKCLGNGFMTKCSLICIQNGSCNRKLLEDTFEAFSKVSKVYFIRTRDKNDPSSRELLEDWWTYCKMNRV